MFLPIKTPRSALKIATAAALILFSASSPGKSDVEIERLGKSVDEMRSLLQRNAIGYSYALVTTQYPNIQEELFANNEAILEKIKKAATEKMAMTDFVIAKIYNPYFSYHSIRVRDSKTITVNLQCVRNLDTTRTLLYATDLELDAWLNDSHDNRLLIDEIHPNTTSNIGPEAIFRPWEMLQATIQSDLGVQSLGSLRKMHFVTHDTETDGSVMSMSTLADSIATIHWNKQTGLPSKIESFSKSSSGKEIKQITEVKYTVIEGVPDQRILFPSSFKTSKSLKINGIYKQYISLQFYANNIKIIDPSVYISHAKDNMVPRLSSEDLNTLLKGIED